MVWVSADASDDAASSIDCVKSKPLKRRCAGGALGRPGGLSRYYSSKSQSFSSLELVTQCTPYGTSSLALAKRRSSFDLQRQATAAAAAAAVAAAAVPGAGVIAKSCSVRLVGGGSPAAPSSARAAAAARFASAFAAACSLAAGQGQGQDGAVLNLAPGAGRGLLGHGCSSSDDDGDLLLSGDGEADDETAPERRCGGGGSDVLQGQDAATRCGDGEDREEEDDEDGTGGGFFEEDDEDDELLCGPSSRRCPCNDTIFADPSDAVLSPDASPPLQHLSLQSYAAGADGAGDSRAAVLAAAAALAAGGGCADGGLAVARPQLALQQQLTAEYCNRLAAVLLPSGHSVAASSAACGSGCSSGSYMGGFGGLPPMAPSRPVPAPRAPLHAFRSTDWDGGAAAAAAAAAAGGGAIGACAAAAGGPRIWTSLSAGGVASGPSCFDTDVMQQDARRPAAPAASCGGAALAPLALGLAPLLTALPPRAPAAAQQPSPCALAGLALSQPGSGDWASSPLLQAPASASSPCHSAATTATTATAAAASVACAASTRTTAQSGFCGLGPQHARPSHHHSHHHSHSHRTPRHHGSPAQLSSLWGSTENLIASLSLSEQQQQQNGGMILQHQHSAKRRGHGRSLSHRTAPAAAADPMAVDAQPPPPQQMHPQMLHEPLPACLAAAYWSAGAAADAGRASACVSIPLAHAAAAAAAAAMSQAPAAQAAHDAFCPWPSAPYGSAPAHSSVGFLSSTIR